MPIFVGGTINGVLQDRLGKHVGNKNDSYLQRLEELPLGDTAVRGWSMTALTFSVMAVLCSSRHRV
jgi:hypothetical protein